VLLVLAVDGNQGVPDNDAYFTSETSSVWLRLDPALPLDEKTMKCKAYRILFSMLFAAQRSTAVEATDAPAETAAGGGVASAHMIPHSIVCTTDIGSAELPHRLCDERVRAGAMPRNGECQQLWDDIVAKVMPPKGKLKPQDLDVNGHVTLYCYLDAVSTNNRVCVANAFCLMHHHSVAQDVLAQDALFSTRVHNIGL